MHTTPLPPLFAGQVLQQPKMEFAHPPSPKPAASNQELLQRMQMLQQQNKRQEAAQQHFIALQQKIQQQQLQQQKILQSLQTPPNSKPANPAAAMLSASLLNPPRNDANIDSHGGPNANPLANPSLTRSRSSNSHTTGGGPPQPNSVPLYISQADKLPPRNAGSCVRRLMQYMYHQRKRSADNSIEFWREFVSEYFAPGAKKRWCVSCYSHNGRSPAGVFPQEVWHCELCGADPGRGFGKWLTPSFGVSGSSRLWGYAEWLA